MALLGIVAIGLCFVPGFDALDYYASLALAAVGGLVGGFAGVGVARDALRGPAPLGATPAGPGWVFRRSALAALCLMVPPAVILLLDALRVRNCDPVEGFAFYLMGAGFSIFFAVQLGAAVGLVSGGRALGHALFFAVWLAWIGRDLWHMYSEPPISAYNPFIGFYSGAVYDDVIVIDRRLIAYRLVNLVELGVVWQLVGMAWDAAKRRLSAAGLARASWRAWVALVVVTTGFGLAFGLRATLGFELRHDDIVRALGGELSDDRIVLYYDAETIDQAEAEALLEDHRFRLSRLEARLGIRHPRKIESFVYGSPAQKRALMGGSRVDIARPWLDQIHLNRLSYGDPVLQHELAHVVLGGVSPGPFHVPFRGIAPQMALVEGAAEALEPAGGPLLTHEWAAALRRAALDPDILAIMGPGGFWSQPAGKAYVAAGSFLGWLLETRGPEAFLAAYDSGDLEAAYGQPLPALVRGWQAWLDQLVLPEDAIALAVQRYDRQGVFARVCPLETARLETEIGRAIDRGDLPAAMGLTDRVAAFTPNQPRALGLVAVVRSLAGDADGVAAALARLEGIEGVDAATLTRVRELLADARWRAGDAGGAAKLYGDIAEATQSEDRRRGVLVKRDTAQSPAREPILGPYLLGTGEGEGDDATEYLKEAVTDLPGDPLPLYLVARRMLGERDFATAARAAATAGAGLAPGVASGLGEDTRALMDRENAWSLGVAETRAGDYSRATASFVRARALTPWSGRRAAIDDWLARVAWLSARTEEN